MKEIYTGDLIELAQKCAEKISGKINYSGYVIEDECCDLLYKVRKILYERLSIAFNELIEEEIDFVESREDLKKRLFKIINDL
jgi:hypothetical protein